MAAPAGIPPENLFDRAVTELGKIKDNVVNKLPLTDDTVKEAGKHISSARDHIKKATKERWHELQSHIETIQQAAEGKIDVNVLQEEVGKRVISLMDAARANMSDILDTTTSTAASAQEGLTGLLAKGMEQWEKVSQKVMDFAASIGAGGLNQIADFLKMIGSPWAETVRSFAETPALKLRAVYKMLEKENDLNFLRATNDSDTFNDILTIYTGVEFNKEQRRKTPPNDPKNAAMTKDQFFEMLKTKLLATKGARPATLLSDVKKEAVIYSNDFPLPIAPAPAVAPPAPAPVPPVAPAPAPAPPAAPAAAPGGVEKDLIGNNVPVEGHIAMVDGPRGIVLIDGAKRWRLEGRGAMGVKLSVEILEAKLTSDGNLSFKLKHPVSGELITKTIPKPKVGELITYLSNDANTEYPLPNIDASGAALPPTAFFVKF